MQGFNMGKYRPPAQLDPSLDMQPVARQPHALGARARKLSQGILVVRFEMPFAIWCSSCPASSSNRLIGQGVRFNAEKKKVGNYFSTPVWSFCMKHTACGGWMEIRTDPKSSEYIVADGAKRRDVGEDEAVAAREGAVVLPSEKEKKRQDAFEAFEGKAAEKTVMKNEAKRVELMRSLRERDWRDTDASNRKLRAIFRVDRKEREVEAKGAEKLQEKLSLMLDILPENNDDKIKASRVEFGSSGGNKSSAMSKLLFESRGAKVGNSTRSKIYTLQQQIVENTRAATSPIDSDFPQTLPSPRSAARIIVRKHSRRFLNDNNAPMLDEPIARQEGDKGPVREKTNQPLVMYDSE